LTIIKALDDERLFKPWFRGPSWDGWRTVLKAAFAIPLNEAELEFFHRCAGRPARSRWCKSTTMKE
jgi:hypothetical protein